MKECEKGQVYSVQAPSKFWCNEINYYRDLIPFQRDKTFRYTQAKILFESYHARLHRREPLLLLEFRPQIIHHFPMFNMRFNKTTVACR